MRYVLMAAFVFFAVVTDLEAGPVRRSRQSMGGTAAPAVAAPAASAAVPSVAAKSATPAVEKAATVNGVEDALAEVNAARAKRGLAPFSARSTTQSSGQDLCQDTGRQFY